MRTISLILFLSTATLWAGDDSWERCVHSMGASTEVAVSPMEHADVPTLVSKMQDSVLMDIICNQMTGRVAKRIARERGINDIMATHEMAFSFLDLAVQKMPGSEYRGRKYAQLTHTQQAAVAREMAAHVLDPESLHQAAGTVWFSWNSDQIALYKRQQRQSDPSFTMEMPTQVVHISDPRFDAWLAEPLALPAR